MISHVLLVYFYSNLRMKYLIIFKNFSIELKFNLIQKLKYSDRIMGWSLKITNLAKYLNKEE
jgi:hypothetical protein